MNRVYRVWYLKYDEIHDKCQSPIYPFCIQGNGLKYRKLALSWQLEQQVIIFSLSIAARFLFPHVDHNFEKKGYMLIFSASFWLQSILGWQELQGTSFLSFQERPWLLLLSVITLEVSDIAVGAPISKNRST